MKTKHFLMFHKFFFKRKTFYEQPTQLNYQTLTAEENYQTLTAEDIRNMPMDQYAELRKSLSFSRLALALKNGDKNNHDH